MKDLRHWLADELVRAAAERMRQRHPDWADAMTSEHAALSGHKDQLSWAFGSLKASFGLEDAFYPAVLWLAIAAMALYQWSADESLITLFVLAGLALALGFLRPSRFLISGVVVGVVVFGVNSFETLSGVRPTYETYQHSWAHNLRWLVLILPALLSSAVGRTIGLKLLAS